MQFQSKIEAYLHALYTLNHITLCAGAPPNLLEDTQAAVQEAINNHEQNPTQVSQQLDKILPFIDNITQRYFLRVIKAIEDSNYNTQTAYDKFANPLGRLVESQICITLLNQPTHKMMIAVGEVSAAIIKALVILEQKTAPDAADTPDNQLAQQLLTTLYSSLDGKKQHALGFGNFTEQPKLAEIIAILTNNQPTQLPTIMRIHYLFAQHIMATQNWLGVAPVRPATGQLKKIIANKIGNKKYKNTPDDFFKLIVTKNLDEFINLFYNSWLYKDTGYNGEINTPITTDKMGLFLAEQKLYLQQSPTASIKWLAHSQNDQPALDSNFVIDCLDNDMVYVHGASKMAAEFLTLMELFANFDKIEKKQNYLAAIVAYLVCGGFHSIHEVLLPAEFILKLVPGYKINPPDTEFIAEPANYQAFFNLLLKKSSTFKKCHMLSWEAINHFYEESYLINNYRNELIEETGSLAELRYESRRKIQSSQNKNRIENTRFIYNHKFSWFNQEKYVKKNLKDVIEQLYEDVLKLNCYTAFEKGIIKYLFLSHHKTNPFIYKFIPNNGDITTFRETLEIKIHWEIYQKYPSAALGILSELTGAVKKFNLLLSIYFNDPNVMHFLDEIIMGIRQAFFSSEHFWPVFHRELTKSQTKTPLENNILLYGFLSGAPDNPHLLEAAQLKDAKQRVSEEYILLTSRFNEEIHEVEINADAVKKFLLTQIELSIDETYSNAEDAKNLMQKVTETADTITTLMNQTTCKSFSPIGFIEVLKSLQAVLAQADNKLVPVSLKKG